jgi:hypothetical protein
VWSVELRSVEWGVRQCGVGSVEWESGKLVRIPRQREPRVVESVVMKSMCCVVLTIITDRVYQSK